MSNLQIAVLALVQGITEFLPISSSAHLILVPHLLGWPDQGLLIDIAVHVGSLGAVLVYFRQDLLTMLRGATDWQAASAMEQPGRRLVMLVAIGTAPVVVAGFALSKIGTAELRNVAVIGWTTLAFGLLLYLADRFTPQRRGITEMSFLGAFLIGLSQVFALIPGTSRSGVTMTAARALGLRRDEAARFSLLLSIPTILAAGVLLVRDLVRLGQTGLGADAVVAALLAFVSAWAAIALMMQWLRRASFTPFVVYRCALGLALLAYAYRG
jgi:undecaprenyl-diphosphatase